MNDINVVGSVIKSSETCIQFILSRKGRKHGDPADWKGGVSVTVRALPRVEEFMQNLGNGTVDPQTSGRYWISFDERPLSAYIIQPVQAPMSDDGSAVSLNRLGQPLLMTHPDSGNTVVNLSLLRLRGISEGTGVTFGLRGVYSLTELHKVRDKLVCASRRFYDEFVRPVDIGVTIYGSTSEVKL